MLGSILLVVQQAQQGLSCGMQWDLTLGFSLQPVFHCGQHSDCLLVESTLNVSMEVLGLGLQELGQDQMQ